MSGTFFWHDILTPDVAKTERFYSAVLGWNITRIPNSNDTYRQVFAGRFPVGGMMESPRGEHASTSVWRGYVLVDDVDATVEQAVKRGGTILREPSDIPGGYGRFAEIADPHGANVIISAPKGEGGPTPEPGTPSTFAWNELHAGNLDEAWEFYAAIFGWSKGQAVEMGDAGLYQVFSVGDRDLGGMMSVLPDLPRPQWLYYINVEAVDAAADLVTKHGGTIVHGPAQVAGGAWIINAIDPCGAHFGLVAPKR